jgi:hypothetical protein
MGGRVGDGRVGVGDGRIGGLVGGKGVGAGVG